MKIDNWVPALLYILTGISQILLWLHRRSKIEDSTIKRIDDLEEDLKRVCDEHEEEIRRMRAEHTEELRKIVASVHALKNTNQISSSGFDVRLTTHQISTSELNARLTVVERMYTHIDREIFERRKTKRDAS